MCSIEGCEGNLYAKGDCRKHYQKALKTREPRPRYSDPEEAFAARTEWQGECLVWTGSTSSGYGEMRRGSGKVRTHRYAYERVHGPIPAGLVIDHLCHNRACSNVEHLRAVTQKQNVENVSGRSKNNSSGHSNVYFNKEKGKWSVWVKANWKASFGGYFQPYEIHVAAYQARNLRNELFTHNDLDRNC